MGTLSERFKNMKQHELTRVGKSLSQEKAYIKGTAYDDNGERCYIVVGLDKTVLVPIADRPSWVIFCEGIM